MKKVLCSIAVIFSIIVFSTNFAFADGDLAAVLLTNIMKLTADDIDGINVSQFDLTNSKYAATSQKAFEEDHEKYPNVTVLNPKWSDKQVPKNSKPNQKYGLLNYGQPIEVVTYGNKLLFKYFLGDSFRILDSKGKQVFEYVAEKEDQGEHQINFELECNSIPQNYYIEFGLKETVSTGVPGIGIGPFSIPLGNTTKKQWEYCYLLLRVSASGREKQFFAGSEDEKKAKEAEKDAQKRIDAIEGYLKNTKGQELTEENYKNLTFDEIMKIQDPQYGGTYNIDIKNMPDKQRKIYEAYMKKHGIKRFEDLTLNDMVAISEEAEKLEEQEERKLSPRIKRKTKSNRKSKED